MWKAWVWYGPKGTQWQPIRADLLSVNSSRWTNRKQGKNNLMIQKRSILFFREMGTRGREVHVCSKYRNEGRQREVVWEGCKQVAGGGFPFHCILLFLSFSSPPPPPLTIHTYNFPLVPILLGNKTPLFMANELLLFPSPNSLLWTAYRQQECLNWLLLGSLLTYIISRFYACGSLCLPYASR
jgi:hypothetical protein